MKKILILAIIFSLFLINVHAKQVLGPDLVIESVNIEPYPVEQGLNFDIDITFRNSNSKRTINDLSFNIQEGFPFTTADGNKVQRVSSLAPNEQVKLNFKIKTDEKALNGQNELKLEYQESAGVKYVSDPININVRATAVDLSIVSLKTNPEIIKPGDEVEIVLTLKNTVPVLMKDIEINFDVSAENNPFTPIKSTTKRSIDSLNKGAEKDLTFNLAVDANAQAGVYKIPLEITYDDEFGNEYSIDTVTGLKISTEPSLQYSIDETEVYSNGNSGKVTIKIVNMGLSDVKFLSLNLLESPDYKVISVPNVYLGNLESDDYETAEFRIFVDTKKKELPLKVLIRYKDSFNKQYAKEEELILPLYSSNELNKFGIVNNGKVGSIVSVIIAAVFMYLFGMEWRKEKSIPKALKMTVLHFLRFIVKIIKAIRLRTLGNAVKKIVRFFKET